MEEICKHTFGGSQIDNEPFYGIGHSVNVNETLQVRKKHKIDHTKMKIQKLIDFILRKVEIIDLSLDSGISKSGDKEEPEGLFQTDEMTGVTSQYNIKNLGKLVAGNEINVTNITNILQQIEKEIEESDLEPQQKEEVSKVLKEGSGTMAAIGCALAKYGGKFKGHTTRSFLGLG